MSLTAINILNSNDVLLEDAYDGVRYTFPPGNATRFRPKRLSKGLTEPLASVIIPLQ
jgi:hypothetical protein